MNATSVTTTITIRVLLFAQLRSGFETDELAVSLPSGATGAELMSWLSQRRPKVTGLLNVSRLAIHCEYVSPDRVLQNQEEVVIIPPVSGG